ncbi:hypothetical protein PILCRDRAFT_666753 [Piloderma croceum F 1598]|uniref:Uncharacterized protein n=1 Tax=Piloderma croceum (strain F 1598) TaxID=765440 RepID=A0A0C3APA4_PILCF|nr:hypothetical protein PILCRDRAFT_666753 [Piloderma croceum F 1598]
MKRQSAADLETQSRNAIKKGRVIHVMRAPTFGLRQHVLSYVTVRTHHVFRSDQPWIVRPGIRISGKGRLNTMQTGVQCFEGPRGVQWKQPLRIWLGSILNHHKLWVGLI